MNESTLISLAAAARDRAYCPYSRFAVGAALLTASGEVITGCNVENLSYGLTLCAERNALASAIAQGHSQFLSITIVADTTEPVSPCGTCRQVLAEFAPDLPIVMATLTGRIERLSLSYLLPRAKTGILNYSQEI